MRDETQLINRALELVRDGLRSGEIPAENFDMGIWVGFDIDPHSTVACIGGWTELLLDRAGFSLDALAHELEDRRLEKLLSPLGCYWNPDFCRLITPEQAAVAIDRHLDGQEPWPAGREAA